MPTVNNGGPLFGLGLRFEPRRGNSLAVGKFGRRAASHTEEPASQASLTIFPTSAISFRGGR